FVVGLARRIGDGGRWRELGNGEHVFAQYRLERGRRRGDLVRAGDRRVVGGQRLRGSVVAQLDVAGQRLRPGEQLGTVGDDLLLERRDVQPRRVVGGQGQLAPDVGEEPAQRALGGGGFALEAAGPVGEVGAAPP